LLLAVCETIIASLQGLALPQGLASTRKALRALFILSEVVIVLMLAPSGFNSSLATESFLSLLKGNFVFREATVASLLAPSGDLPLASWE